MDQSTQPPFITDDTWQCGIITSGSHTSWPTRASVSSCVYETGADVVLCEWQHTANVTIVLTDWGTGGGGDLNSETQAVVCLSRVKAMGIWSAGTSSAKSVSHQHSELIEGDNPRSVLSVSAHDPLLGGQASHTRTQSWMEASVCLFPARLITRPSALAKDKDSLHSNIWIPPLTGCSGGDWREQPGVWLDVGVCVCVPEVLREQLNG